MRAAWYAFVLFISSLTLPACAFCAANPADPRCIVANQVIDCTTSSVMSQSGRGEAVAVGLITTGTVDTATLLSALISAGFSDGECIIAALASDYSTKPAVASNMALFLQNYNTWMKTCRKNVQYKILTKVVS